MAKKMLTQNAKLKKTSKVTGIKTLDFALPAKKTCPYARECKKFCYADKGSYLWAVVKEKHQWNLNQTQLESFVDNMIIEIKKAKAKAIRIHSSGDFYNVTYFKKWISIANQCPDIKFYAYTKSLPIVKKLENLIPPNLTLIYSYGGKHDDMIDKRKDRHAVVYDDVLPSGYSYSNDNDLIALARNKKIGLKKH